MLVRDFFRIFGKFSGIFMKILAFTEFVMVKTAKTGKNKGKQWRIEIFFCFYKFVKLRKLEFK